jgi:hypothetical protein
LIPLISLRVLESATVAYECDISVSAAGPHGGPPARGRDNNAAREVRSICPGGAAPARALTSAGGGRAARAVWPPSDEGRAQERLSRNMCTTLQRCVKMRNAPGEAKPRPDNSTMRARTASFCAVLPFAMSRSSTVRSQGATYRHAFILRMPPMEPDLLEQRKFI